MLSQVTDFENSENAFRIIAGDFVTTEDGTGIVHTAPTFGADDAKVASEANPPVPPLLVPKLELKEDFIDNLFDTGMFSPFSGITFSNYINQLDSIENGWHFIENEYVRASSCIKRY